MQNPRIQRYTKYLIWKIFFFAYDKEVLNAKVLDIYFNFY